MIVFDHWVENLRCPSCRKTGAARLSQADGWNAQVDSVPEGFKVVGFVWKQLLLLFMRQPSGPLEIAETQAVR
jgi:hypothetical protein